MVVNTYHDDTKIRDKIWRIRTKEEFNIDMLTDVKLRRLECLGHLIRVVNNRMEFLRLY